MSGLSSWGGGDLATATLPFNPPLRLPAREGRGRRDDRNEIRRFQAGAPDQRAIDVGNAEDFTRVRGLDGAAIEDAGVGTISTVALAQFGADCQVHLGYLRARRDLAGSDRPDRLIGNREFRLAIKRRRQGAVELCSDGVHRTAMLTHIEAFADAQYDVEADRERRFGLGLHLLVALTLPFATFGVANDRQAGAGIERHQRRYAAGVRALLGMMNVLSADRKARDRAGGAFDQDRGDAQSDVDAGIFAGRRRNRPDLVEIGR